ncbi:unnamed protein product [Lactuca virosa]|uniref:Integrase catalytic domain-containing protein n=1 Tax=Lactuca virosa TaxID=75947 RepID=A0AAU9NW90_9ASTR|nr:unnamed protein product [Lactuca virosa]
MFLIQKRQFAFTATKRGIGRDLAHKSARYQGWQSEAIFGRCVWAFRSTTRAANRFYVTFTDDYSRYGYIYLISISQKLLKSSKSLSMKSKSIGQKDKDLRSDRGGRVSSIEFNDYLKECGIVSQLTPPRTPQLNGVAESAIEPC